jgi:hypothetical protein
MAFLSDLCPCTYLPCDPGDAILSIGWLEKGAEFRKGRVPANVFARLKELCRRPWQPFVACGFHECTLCQLEGARGSANVFIPGEGVIYVCPELILHYICAHWYLPPDEFCEAVRRCPDQHTMEYKRLLLQNGGRRLLQALQGSANDSTAPAT